MENSELSPPRPDPTATTMWSASRSFALGLLFFAVGIAMVRAGVTGWKVVLVMAILGAVIGGLPRLAARFNERRAARRAL